jgi:hypothetical protein
MIRSKLRTYLFANLSDLKDIFLADVRANRNPRQVKAHLAEDKVTLVMDYPLIDGSYLTKTLRYPDEEMAKAGHQRFLRDVADRLPGHHERKHLRAMRLNNELIGSSHLDWKLGEEPDYGVQNSAALDY